MSLRVSAIITTYNYERYVAEAVESVLAQTRPPDEIIVVDDGSTDGTAAIVARYAPRGVRYVAQANAGAGAARNRGVRESCGELLAFLDADDTWLPDKLERQLRHLRQFPAAGLVTGGEWQVREGGQAPWLLRRPPVDEGNLWRRLLIENCVGNPSLTLVRRACLARVGLFDEGLPLGQDWDLWIRIGRAFPIGVLAAPLINYRRHSGSLSLGRIRQRYDANRALHRRHIGPVRPFWRRLVIQQAARSMNCFYAAAALGEDPARRAGARALALAAIALDPIYQGRLKAALLLRLLAGRAAFDVARRVARMVR